MAAASGASPSRLHRDEEPETAAKMRGEHPDGGEINGSSERVGEQQDSRRADAEEEEEEGECGFCLFMKGGPCREEFIAWEDCVETAERNEQNVVDACFEVTSLLRKCMEAHDDYYEPILRAEKAMAEEEAEKEPILESTQPVESTASAGVSPSPNNL
ncbi:uncharacterized protein LOC144707221 isoform X2 [Wolffia australiana]